MQHTCQSLLREGESRLSKAGITEAKVDAWLLFTATTGLDRTQYFMRGKDAVDESVVTAYLEKIARRAGREPLQYIEGRAPFMGYEFAVNENVLIPRMDTEILAAEAVSVAGRMCVSRLRGTEIRVLDMCTGSGCIIESVYLKLKEQGYMVRAAASDVSDKALDVAKQNAVQLGADIAFYQGNLFENVHGTYHMILSNPPYIRTDVIEGLEPEVKDHEPVLALDGMKDGLYFYRRIIHDAKEFLEKNGILMLEIGYDQGMEVTEICRMEGYSDVKIIKDFAGLERVVTARFSAT